MSTKSHILYSQSIEVFVETSEPQAIFGHYQGDNIYFIVEWDVLDKAVMKEDYLFVNLKENEHLPQELQFWGGCIVKFEVDSEGLLIIFEGGWYTKEMEKNNFAHYIKKET